MSYQCTTPGCPNKTAQFPFAAAENLNFKCFICEGDLVEPSVTMEEMLDKIDVLPVSLQILPRLQQLLQNDDVSLDVIATTTRVDTSLVTRLIHVANSAYYSLAHGGVCSSVEQALMRIGLNKAYSVVGYVASKPVYDTDLPLYMMTGEVMWENSVRMAYCMEKLATQLFVESSAYEYPDPTMAYTAGLVWPVGKTVISQYYKTHGLEQLDNLELPLTQAKEKQALGFTHLDITIALMEKWRFPDKMVTAIKYKDKPLISTGDRPLSCLLSLVIDAVHLFPVTDLDIEDIDLYEMVEHFKPNEDILAQTGIPKEDFVEVILSSIQFIKTGHIVGQIK